MEWNTATLLAPRTGGRSRFSKALPMPPSPPHETPPESITAAAATRTPTTATSPAFQIPRKLPGLPNMATTMALPPRKDSVGARFIPKPIDSPLPALPALPDKVSSPLELQKKMPPIPRKAVASPPPVGSSFTSSPPLEQLEPEAVDPVKLKRKSSISSLLSAYSNTSSESVHMSSHRSSDTKGSEASLSPDRDGQRGGQQRDLSAAYKALSRNPYEEPSAREKEFMMHEPLPPPPPTKEANASPRPAAQRTGLPATPRGGRLPAAPAPAAAPATIQKDGDAFTSAARKTPSPPPRREIWRRRASSKSDRSIAVSGLKLAVSHGSTAATTMAASQPAPAEEASQKAAQHPAILNPTLALSANNGPQLPPQPNSGLPGRNIRPQAQAQTQPQQSATNNAIDALDNDDEMKRLRELKMQALGQSASQDSDKSTSHLQPLDSPTLKPSPAGFPTILGAPESTRTAADDQPPLSPPTKSLRRREVGRKPSLQNIKGSEAGAAQHLREARSAIDLRAARDKQAEAAMENFPALEPPHFPGQYYGGAPSPRSPRTRGLSSASNASGRRVPNPQLMVTSPATPPAPRPRVEYKDMEYIQMTPQQQNDLSAAIRKAFGHSKDWARVTPNKDGVWPCRELSADHLTCASDHKGWVNTPNAHYPIACMLCHDGSKESRRVCRSCGIRVCPGCSELLTGVKIENLDFNALASKEKEKEDAIAGDQEGLYISK
ncbi:hypothetical protein PFICI_08131 [Pestalotiopsis fici W106-1]|uniref:Uncharacterized protein n=1 Tax=Pestalotiopsis fici (strain W106-1 / CGMCC3.15140) TaxID=1229662 RepID=W3X5A8_PESFW|nr:uncharacterized protein PFICI_08131 [Pestalotiopsis fici W106-1]ETS80602.1 hypothetical protein PFICI_08131 [Pestalotiopsis fici W106-1]